jgi:Hint domain-containing protein
MADLVTSHLYLLDQNGQSSNAKVVVELFPNSQATSTEATADGVLMPGEHFSTTFAFSPDLELRFGGLTFTYIGTDPDVPGAVAEGSNGSFFLFSDDGTIAIGTNMNGITAVPIVLCFLAGTMIRCPSGERAVETLAIGDLIFTAEGRVVPVIWVGRQTVATLFGLPEGRRPVCIAAGALADNLPNRDLRLTSDHALLIDDVLVHAGALVNGSTIRRIPNAELGGRFTVYHIETQNHEIILAEGTPAETFVDNATRRRYDNYPEYESMYGAQGRSMEELPYPRAMSPRQLPTKIRSQIARRAAALSVRLAQAS